jgi:hypothetical protein
MFSRAVAPKSTVSCGVERLRLGTGRIAERHGVEMDPAARRPRELERQRRRLDRRQRLLELDEPLHRAGRALHLAPHLAQARGRDTHVPRVEQELGELPERELARKHLARADPEHERDPAEHERRRERREQRADPPPAHGNAERALHRVAEALRVQPLERERLHGLHRVDRLRRERARVRDAVLGVARQPPQSPAEHQQGTHDQRHRDHDHERELRARRDEQHERAEQRDRRAQRDRNAVARDRLHERRVGREPRQHLARACDLEEARVHADHARIDRAADVGDDALAEPRDEIEAQRRERAEHDGGAQERDEVAVDRRRVADHEAFVDQEPQRDRQRELRPGRDEQRADGRREHAPMGCQVRRERAQRLERRAFRPFFGCVSHVSSVARNVEDRLGRGNLRDHLVSCASFERRHDAKFATTPRRTAPASDQPSDPISGRPRGMSHTLSHSSAFAHPGNKSLRGPWIESRGEFFPSILRLRTK